MTKKRKPTRQRNTNSKRRSLAERRLKSDLGNAFSSLEEGRSTMENLEQLLKGTMPSTDDVTATFDKFFGEFRDLDLRKELDKARAPQERATSLVLEAVLAGTPAETEEFAQRAIEAHPGCVDGWRILGELARNEEERRACVAHALEAAETAIGDEEPDPDKLHHRPWFRLQSALAVTAIDEDP
jgi:hypothetical protein